MANNRKHIWLGIEALAAALDSDQKAAEEMLDHLEKDLAALSAHDRGGMRRKMITVVAQLSRLEVRMMTGDTP